MWGRVVDSWADFEDFDIFDLLDFGFLVFGVSHMACGSLAKRSGTKFRFRGLPEDPKIVSTDPFYEEKAG